MPEQITKYPQVTMKVIESAGGVCAQGAPQKILKQCPADQFCALPGGEVCIYGVDEIAQMTQITPQELARSVCPAGREDPMNAAALSGFEGLALGAVFIAGLVLGRLRRSPRLPE